MYRQSNVVCFFTFVLLLAQVSFAEPPPGPQIVNETISAARINWEKFENESFVPRMQFEISGRLLKESDKASFCEFASIARNEIDRDFNQQQSLLEQIENYEGTDWEQLYGSSEAWRRLAASVENTKLNKAQVDYYLVIVCAGPRQQKALEKILLGLGWPKQNPSADILTAKILCVLARMDKKYPNPAEQQFSKLKLRSDLAPCDAIKVSIEQIKCFGPAEPNEINNLTQSFVKSECSDDREMLLSLANLQRKFLPDELQRTLSRSPQTAILLGQLILNDLSARFAESTPSQGDLNSISPVDAELAAATALFSPGYLQQAQGISNLITYLADNDRFQTPAVAYLSAALIRQTNPKKSATFLIKASNLQAKHANLFLPITPEDMARQAFEVTYQEFLKDPNDCQPAIDAYENYSRVAASVIDEQTRYLYANLLNNCNRTDEAAKAFRRLADQSQSLWHDAAMLELLKIELNKATSPAESNEVLTRLHDFILGCTRSEERETQIRWEAMSLYCKLLLDRNSNEAAQQVLHILDNAPPTPGLQYEIIWAQALRQLDRLEESVIFMSKAVDDNDCSIIPQAIALLSEVLDKIELWQQTAADFNQMLLNCDKLAGFDYKCLNDRQNTLILAEISILQEKRSQTPFLPEDQNDINWLRVQARLLMAKGDFTQAILLWAKIAELRRNDINIQNRKSYSWWQAKFYELNCLAKLPSTKPQDIRHTIEVLESTYTNIPVPWAEKLNALKQQCAAN